MVLHNFAKENDDTDISPPPEEIDAHELDQLIQEGQIPHNLHSYLTMLEWTVQVIDAND